MKQLIQVIVDNKEWIFSGIGVVIVVGIIRIFFVFFGKKTRQQNIKGGDSSTNIQTGNGSTITVSSISPTTDKQVHMTKPIKIDRRGCTINTTRINEGDYQEFIYGHTTIKVAVSEIVKKKLYHSYIPGEIESIGAVLEISTDGGLVHGGEDCKKEGTNKYLIPQKETQVEETYSVYAYHAKKDYFNFFRVYIDHVNPHTRQVTLNLFFVNIYDIKSS